MLRGIAGRVLRSGIAVALVSVLFSNPMFVMRKREGKSASLKGCATQPAIRQKVGIKSP